MSAKKGYELWFFVRDELKIKYFNSARIRGEFKARPGPDISIVRFPPPQETTEGTRGKKGTTGSECTANNSRAGINYSCDDRSANYVNSTYFLPAVPRGLITRGLIVSAKRPLKFTFNYGHADTWWCVSQFNEVGAETAVWILNVSGGGKERRVGGMKKRRKMGRCNCSRPRRVANEKQPDEKNSSLDRNVDSRWVVRRNPNISS